MSELKGKTVKIGEGRIMFHYGEAEPTDTEYEIVFTIVQCKDCKYWIKRKNYKDLCTYWAINTEAMDFCSRGELK